MLRRVAIAMVDLAATMAMLSVTIPHAALLTTSVLVLVIAAVVLLGREYTGAWDLPGPVRGVLLVATGGARPAGRLMPGTDRAFSYPAGSPQASSRLEQLRCRD